MLRLLALELGGGSFRLNYCKYCQNEADFIRDNTMTFFVKKIHLLLLTQVDFTEGLYI